MEVFKPTLVVIDEDIDVLSALSQEFESSHHVYTTIDVDDFREQLRVEKVHAVLCAQQLSPITGIALLAEVKRLSPETSRLLLIEQSEQAGLVGCIEADDMVGYVVKPWQRETLRQTIFQATRHALNMQISQSGVFAATVPHHEKLLLIDDDEHIHLLLNSQFASVYDIDWADNIDKAMSLLATHQYGVVVSDIKLNGVNILPFIATLSEQQPLSFIILLARSQTEQLATLINSGAVYRCLSKPVRSSVLEMSVQRAFAAYRNTKNLGYQSTDVAVPSRTDPTVTGI